MADTQFLDSSTMTSPFRDRYDNFIGGRFVAPKAGRYFDNPSPITGKTICAIARSDAADIELALDAAHAAKDAWGKTSVAERALILNRIADRMEENLELLATCETWDNGKPIRETMAADLPLAIDHFRYFAARSTMTPSRITSTSRSAWWARSSRGTSHSSWRSGNSHPRSRPVIASS